jgi:hypothetical protein
MITAKKSRKISNNLSSLKNPRAARTKWYLLLVLFNKNPMAKIIPLKRFDLPETKFVCNLVL